MKKLFQKLRSLFRKPAPTPKVERTEFDSIAFYTTPEEWYDFGSPNPIYHVTNPSFVTDEYLTTTQVADRFCTILTKFLDAGHEFSLSVNQCGIEYRFSHARHLVHKEGEPCKDIRYALHSAIHEMCAILDTPLAESA